jgi:hypothetical protein
VVGAKPSCFLFAFNELKIDFLRTPSYVFQVFLWFGTWDARPNLVSPPPP